LPIDKEEFLCSSTRRWRCVKPNPIKEEQIKQVFGIVSFNNPRFYR